MDSTQTTPNTNPIILNAYGQATVWLDPTKAYKFVLQDAAGNPLYTVDNILGVLSTPSVVIGPPATGVALRVNGSLDGATALVVSNPIGGQPVAAFVSNGTAGTALGVLIDAGTNAADWALRVTNQALTRTLFNVGGAGNVTMPGAVSGATLQVTGADTGGTALVVNGTGSTNPPVAITGGNVAGQSNGLAIFAGTNASDNPLFINSAASATLLTLNGLGAMTVGGVANQTAGSINTSGGFYVNNVKQPTWAAPLAGFGTPTGNVVVTNFSGAAATLVQCSNTIAQILLTLKAAGVYAA